MEPETISEAIDLCLHYGIFVKVENIKGLYGPAQWRVWHEHNYRVFVERRDAIAHMCSMVERYVSWTPQVVPFTSQSEPCPF